MASAHREPTSVNGTLNQNTQCQEMGTSAPPSTGPITTPTAATIVFVPMASPSCSRGKASVTIAPALANRNAPPTPWAIRQRISSVPSPEKPATSEARPRSALARVLKTLHRSFLQHGIKESSGYAFFDSAEIAAAGRGMLLEWQLA